MRRNRARRALVTGLAVLWLGAGPAAAQDPTPEREAAERQLAELKAEIESLRAELDAARGEHRDAQQRLRETELEVQAETLKLREIRAEVAAHQAELERMDQERETYLASLAERRDELSAQVLAAYRLGRQSRLKMLLNQDDPSELSRMMAYYEYVSRAQLERIAGLREALATLERMQADIDAELRALAEVQTRQEATLEALGERREQRAEALAALEGEIGAGESRLAELERNRRDLEALIERLADALADIPADLGEAARLAPRKGQLPMPVPGRLVAAYGQPRAAGLDWQGWLIRAEPGTDVQAVARGRVAYADWLRGYGLLMIIDHGDGYMTLYGHNESLLNSVGDWVEAGQPVATASGDPGLYFELRKDGQAQDPAAWLSRR